MTYVSLTVHHLSEPRHKMTYWPDGTIRLDVSSGERMGAWHVSSERTGRTFLSTIDGLIRAKSEETMPTTPLLLTVETATGLVHLDARLGGARHVALVLEGLASIHERSPLDTSGAMDWTPWSDSRRLVLAKPNLLAQALARREGLVVLAGSVASATTNKSLEDNYQKARSALIDEGALQLENDGFRLTRHIFFQRPSAAASVLTGTNTNGRLHWRNEFGRNWADLGLE